jgi:dTDP-4-amino-4,6-dideoxygalactose transaminase
VASQFKIPLSAPDISETEIEAVVDVLRSGRLSGGPRIAEFERVIAEYAGMPHSAAVSSGTAGLHLAIRALGIGEGDEVIVPSFAFVAVANAVRFERAVPVFADIDPVTLNLDPAAVEQVITSRTRAIIVVHTFGCPAEMDAILEIAARHRLRVIEDACEAIGAEYRGRKTGGLGDIGVFAFYPNKQITTAEGAIIVIRDPELHRRIRMLRNQGRDTDRDWLDVATVGYNYRLSELSAALGVEQMKRIGEILGRRQRVAENYCSELKGVSGIETPRLAYPDRCVSWFVFVVRLREGFTREDRDNIFRNMLARGIECGRYFAPIHLQPAYSDFRCADAKLPVTNRVAERCLALPFFNRITAEDIAVVCASLAETIESVRKH